VELKPYAIVETITGSRIENQRILRAHAVVLDQGARPEVARAQRSEPAWFGAKRHAAACHPGRCARNAIAGKIEIGEAGASMGDIEIEGHPGQDLVLVGPLDADATARPARFGRAGISDKQQLRIEIEHKKRERAGEIVDCLAANAQL